VWKYNLLTCGMKAWFNKLGSKLKPRSSKSRKSNIFKVVLKEWKVARE
jgi:hypothetical protein